MSEPRNNAAPDLGPSGFASGHDLGRRKSVTITRAFSPCGIPFLLEGYGLQAVHNSPVMKSALAAEGCNSFALPSVRKVIWLQDESVIRDLTL
jgi:hypothetical protein